MLPKGKAQLDTAGQHVNVKSNTSFEMSSVVGGKRGKSQPLRGTPSSEVAQVVVKSIVLKESQPAGAGFRTDTDISASASASSHLVGRELQVLDDTWFDGTSHRKPKDATQKKQLGCVFLADGAICSDPL